MSLTIFGGARSYGCIESLVINAINIKITFLSHSTANDNKIAYDIAYGLKIFTSYTLRGSDNSF